MNNAITDAMLANAIKRQQGEFQSRDVICDLMTNHPREYVTDLHGHVTDQDPIQRYHSSIGSRLARFSTIEPTRKITSRNVRGRNTENQGWKKRLT